GWLIPAFYAWTDSDQSRPSPLLWQIPLGVALASIAFCCLLPWLSFPATETRTVESKRRRFSLRSLLILTTLFAMVIGIGGAFPLLFSSLACAGAFAYVLAFAVKHEPHRGAVVALLGSMLLPYAWLVSYDELGRVAAALPALFASLPTFVPGALLGGLFGMHFDDSRWIAILLTAAELVAGVQLIRRGPRRTIAFLLLVMHVSWFSSFVFYQLCIA
ncbi:MAG: hypothetical protein KDA61_17270, partial [Planctomycetales bacterium]|nr:hypothetical protein [Planctomycetales bacterium]